MIELTKIYSEYFAILEKYYFQFYNDSEKHNVSPENILKDVKNTPNLYNHLVNITPIVSALIENFWDKNYTIVYNYYYSIPGLKTRFGGDIGPHKDDKVFQRVGLYFDTIIVPDPILRIATIPATDETKCDYLLKYAINQLYYKDVYLTNINPPIALLIPDKELVRKSKLDFSELTQYGNIDSIIILNSLFDLKLNTIEESNEFLSKFKNIDEVYKEIHKPELIWWDEYSPRDIMAQLESVKRRGLMGLKKDNLPFDINDPRYFLFQLTGRLMQVNDVLVRSDEINASPLIAAPVSFHWLKFKILENQKLFLSNNYKNINLGVTNSLLSTDKEWLGNISLKNLISVRKNGFISDFRKEISSEIEMFGDLSISDLEKVSSQIDLNLSNLFKKHHREIESLQKELHNELAIKGTSFIVLLTIALQPLIGNFLPTWSSTIGGLTGLSTLSEIISGVREHINKKGKLSQSPIGILVNAKNKT